MCGCLRMGMIARWSSSLSTRVASHGMMISLSVGSVMCGVWCGYCCLGTAHRRPRLGGCFPLRIGGEWVGVYVGMLQMIRNQRRVVCCRTAFNVCNMYCNWVHQLCRSHRQTVFVCGLFVCCSRHCSCVPLAQADYGMWAGLSDKYTPSRPRPCTSTPAGGCGLVVDVWVAVDPCNARLHATSHS